MSQSHGPYALSLIICDAIERERPEALATYKGVINLLQAKGSPDQYGGEIRPTPRLYVEARFAAGQARGLHRFGLLVRVGDEDLRTLISREVRLVDVRQEIRLTRTWELRRIPRATIWFDALIDDEVAMRVPFMVEIVSPPPDVPQA